MNLRILTGAGLPLTRVQRALAELLTLTENTRCSVRPCLNQMPHCVTVCVSLPQIASFPVFVAVFLKTASYFHVSKMCLLLCVTETVTCCRNVLMTRTCNECVPENVCVDVLMF